MKIKNSILLTFLSLHLGGTIVISAANADKLGKIQGTAFFLMNSVPVALKIIDSLDDDADTKPSA
ncbi:MAG: hypothetical protein AAF050_15210 [Cyanobacteria bacterium J06649_5]